MLFHRVKVIVQSVAIRAKMTQIYNKIDLNFLYSLINILINNLFIEIPVSISSKYEQC